MKEEKTLDKLSENILDFLKMCFCFKRSKMIEILRCLIIFCAGS